LTSTVGFKSLSVRFERKTKDEVSASSSSSSRILVACDVLDEV